MGGAKGEETSRGVLQREVMRGMQQTVGGACQLMPVKLRMRAYKVSCLGNTCSKQPTPLS